MIKKYVKKNKKIIKRKQIPRQWRKRNYAPECFKSRSIKCDIEAQGKPNAKQVQIKYFKNQDSILKSV